MLKEKIYDDFKCLADKCEMTCCRGWAIKVENSDIEKWKSTEATKYLCEKVKPRSEDYVMKLKDLSSCIMLDDCGLCNIVKEHGDEFLSKTCAEFPRKHNYVEEYIDEETKGDVLLEEFSMSGACPGVLELIADYEDNLIEIPESCRDNKEFPFEYQIRNMLIDFFQNDSFSLMEKCLLSFSFLHECLECEWEEDIYSLIDTYRIAENQKNQLEALAKLNVDTKAALIEVGQTFLDMTEFYKEEDMYRPYLNELYNFCEKLDTDIDERLEQWLQFKNEYSKYDSFMSKVMAAEIFSDCISDDLGVIIEGLQTIVLEYCMTRMSLFIKKELGDALERKMIIKYFSLFIRMLGHNVEGMCEYWEDNFEDSILELDYLKILLT